jgi:hypothetical protein
MSVGNRVNQAAEPEIYRVNRAFSGAKIRPGYKVVTGAYHHRGLDPLQLNSPGSRGEGVTMDLSDRFLLRTKPRSAS